MFPIALGCMSMSGMYGASDQNESIATIHAAIDRGVTLLDTGDLYGSGTNEMLIERAIRGCRDEVLLSVKFGALRTPDGGWGRFDGRPAAIRNFLAYTLNRLGTNHIDIYRPSRLDPDVSIEETADAVADLIKAGWARHLGLSGVGVATVRRANAVHPVVDLHIEYSLVSRGPELSILPALRELGIGVAAYGVLSRGLLSGLRPASAGDFRATLPRFRGDNLNHNQRLIDTLSAMAKVRNTTPVRLAVAWVLAQNQSVAPVIGARTRTHLDDLLGALDLELIRPTSGVSPMPFPSRRWPARATTNIRCGCSTASAERRQLATGTRFRDQGSALDDPGRRSGTLRPPVRAAMVVHPATVFGTFH
ncbi:MAG TPA: aldo/keto reductase [Paludibaculum sp.]